ncbi:angiopoietin-2-like [Anopheles ziemanni]|uniref:angiopoietin-2-like n=1 Tax=Anopheles coustani TaxID=139045 RepID=UPI002659EFF9|nr:angiopoietin-2-like [Anopheles coustani]XP_058169476.1 angiopoietin-2-like [Anopheles ziemanni]
MKFMPIPPILVVILIAVVGLQAEELKHEATPAQDIRLLLEEVKSHLNRFNSHYLINLEQRIVSVLTTMTSLDSNVKTLQEKSQIWDVFQHHIGAWSEHIKSVDNKLDILKKTHETPSAALETRLSNLDFKVQHIFEKVDTINEKLHDITKTVYALSSSSSSAVHRGRRNERMDATEQATILTKIGNLQKQINRIESNGNNNNCPNKSNGQGSGNRGTSSSKIRKDVSDSDEEIDDFLDKLTAKKLRELVANRKNCRSMEMLTGMMRSVEDRTVRIYDLEALQFEQILSCCQRTNNEVTTFTNSADILLKRIEHLVLDVDRKIEKRNNQQCSKDPSPTLPDHQSKVKFNNTLEESLDISTQVDLGSGSDESTGDDNVITSASIDQHEEIDFHHPDKDGCHQLLKRVDGVYTFAVVELNEARRDFNRRFCQFATEGSAWTVVQCRNWYDLQENFNRSWNEYKHGFGDLGYEFWFGNDFIHRLSYDDNVELRIELEDFDGHRAYAQYGTFRMESEKFNYNLMVSDYRGNASDALSYHNDQDFSTYDRPNDKSDTFPCALTFGSGWWFNSCAESNLNGKYYLENPRAHKSTGILWETWLGDYSLKSVKMMIRPKDVWNKDDEVSSDAETPQDP